MSANAESDVPGTSEIVILRRRGGDGEDGHHGGAWKIAFADFMTAMMAFFLVMWLVNSSDDKTLTQVASYFNPLKLTDRGTGRKGVHDVKGKDEQAEGKETEGDAKEGKKEKAKEKSKAKDNDKESENASDKKSKADAHQKKKAGHSSKSSKSKVSEDELFSDPYGALEKLALDAREREMPTKLGPGRLGQARSTGGDAFKDPFDLIAGRGPTSQPNITDEENRGLSPAPQGLGGEHRDERVGSGMGEAGANKPIAKKNAADQPAKVADPEQEKQDAAAAERAKIDKEVGTLLQALPAGGKPRVEITTVNGGILISLTDEYDFGMFDVGSAVPNPQLVNVISKLGDLLKTRPGGIVVRGHTDARKYKNGRFDNWQLSSARAQMAAYMLIRGGIDQNRLEHVEGYADRQLRVPAEPNAAQNRRIEILLKNS
jgi:chemotaxis protein MotB